MDNPALAAHRLDQRLRADIGRLVDVGAETERRLGRILRATGERDRGDRPPFELLERRVDADCVAREDAEADIALRGRLSINSVCRLSFHSAGTL